MKFVADTTAINLASFTVEANNGRVMILWETGAEIDNAGFNLYRAAGCVSVLGQDIGLAS